MNSKPHKLAAVFMVAIFVFSSIQVAAAATYSSPKLNIILPRGVQAGTESTLTFAGARLQDAEEILFYDKGVTVKDFKVLDAKRVRVTVVVEEGCRLGEHIAQVRTRSGISDFRSFYVGEMPHFKEVEPNNSFEEAGEAKPNVTINGRIDNEDVDYYKITAEKGTRLSVEVEAIRLGDMFDAFIAILDKDQFEIAVCDDTPLAKQDPYISVEIPETGDYYIMVRETSYGGNVRCWYRLHIGDFPRPSLAYPAGGPAGETTEVKLMGDPLGDIEHQIEAPTTDPFRPGYMYRDDKGVTPSPIPFRVSSFANAFEMEPNNNFDQALKHEPVESPIAINGVIERENDFDYHRFRCKKDGVYYVECFARRVGSNLDPVMNILAPDKKHIVGDDDARRPDTYIRFVAPADGDYFVRIFDHLRRGQADFIYRLEIRPATPELELAIPRVDRFSQRRQAIAVPQGNRFATLVNAKRTYFGGGIKLLEDSLPPGIKMIAPPMHPELSSMPVVFEATEDAEVGGSLIDFVGTHVNEQRDIKGHFRNVAEFALGRPNNARYYAGRVDKLAMAVTEKLPYRLELIQSQSPIVRNGSKNLKIVVHRDEGFEEPIRVEFPFRPPGVGTKPNVTIPKGKNEVHYPLNANGNAKVGKWPIYAIGAANLNGNAWVSTQLAELEVAEPFVTFDIKRAKCVQGTSTVLKCTLNHLHDFEGEAEAHVHGVPPHITVPPLKFTNETKELVFQVTTTDKSPIGKHKGLHCRAYVPHNGETVNAIAGRSSLQITKPKPKPAEPVAKVSDKKEAKGKPAPQPEPSP